MKEIEEIQRQKIHSQPFHSETENCYDQSTKPTLSSDCLIKMNKSTSISSDSSDTSRQHYPSPVPITKWTPMNVSPGAFPVYPAKLIFHRSYKQE